MTTLQEYINGTAGILVGELPSQSLNSAVSLVYAYISDNGGWVPDNPLDPIGPGHLVSNFTEQQTADDITNQQIESVYSIEFQVTNVIKVNVAAKLTRGLTLSAAAAAMFNQVSNFISTSIDLSRLPMAVVSTSTQITDAGNSMTTGFTTQAIREQIASDLAVIGTTKEVDFKGIALFYVRNTYGVDNTWNVHSIYTEPDIPITVMIKKYINTTYATLDGTSTKVYVMNVSPDTYEIVTGVIIG